jgi:short-subunit dehydrogenase
VKIDYSNKIVWITGASSGIGEALAKEFAGTGCTLVLSSRKKEALQRVKDECSGASAVHVVPVDLSSDESILAAFEDVINLTGRVDVLINNAGISQRALVRETAVEVDRRIMQIDYFGHIYLSKLVLPSMLKRGWGQIAATSSVVGDFGFPLRSAYSAAKHALHGFFETLKIEEEKNGILVSLIIPGRVNTSVSINAIDGSGNSYGKMDEGQKGGLSAEVTAQKVFRNMQRNRFKIYIGAKERVLVYLSKWWPSLFFSIARKISST